MKRLVMTVLVVAWPGAFALPAEPAPREAPRPPSTQPAGQPADRADDHAARLAQMPDNSWLKLNPPREPGGRNYSGPCFGGGRLFYFGGAHFSYQGNDVELYDPAANEWTRSWPPQIRPAQDFSGKQTGPENVYDPKTGRLWPVHTYQQVCYVPERKVFFYAGHVGTWQFDPAASKWTNLAGPYSPGAKSSPHTKLAWQTYHTFYSPQLKAPVCIVTASPFGIYVYDFDKAEWSKRAKDVDARMKWYEPYSTYAPTLKAHLISQRGAPFMWLYDAQTEDLKALAEVPEALQGTQALAYDAANNTVIAMAQVKVDPEAASSKISVRPWALDLTTLKWRELGRPPGPVPQGSATGSWAPLCYDSERNVFWFLNRTSQVGCETWAYRYKRVAETGP